MADYYGGMGMGGDDDGGGMSDAAAPSEADSDGKDDTGKNEKEPTALIPKALLAGKDFEPGDEIVMQIVRLYEDEAEIKYAPEKKEKSAMDEADNELAGMGMSEGGMGGGDESGGGNDY